MPAWFPPGSRVSSGGVILAEPNDVSASSLNEKPSDLPHPVILQERRTGLAAWYQDHRRKDTGGLCTSAFSILNSLS
jgi:hypothetical protein